MAERENKTYAASGVNINAGYETVRRIKPMAESTFIPGVLGTVGGFGGLFEPELTGIEDPVLVSGTDGVGTKLKIAFALEKYDTVGIDCVAMCVNDVICLGAKPLFFLDYLAVGKLDPKVASEIVSGVAEGCRQARCALIGGETAEMPGFYPPDEFDLAGFCVGLGDRKKLLDGSTVVAGDLLIALPSSGLHSNGFSLTRKVFGETKESLKEYLPELFCTLGEALLTPTKIYVCAVESLRSSVSVKALCHITGGGFYENIPRMLPDGITAKIDGASLSIPPLFRLLMQRGNIPLDEMYNTYNMGVGMVAVVAPSDAPKALDAMQKAGESAFVLGQCVPGERGVSLW